jgi:chromosome segregation ATPase
MEGLKRQLVNWERTAAEEHALAEQHRDRISLLEDEIVSYRLHNESARTDAERTRSELEGVKAALRDAQVERKRELREVVDGMEGQIERLNGVVERAEGRASEAEVHPPRIDFWLIVDAVGGKFTGVGAVKTV